MDHLTYGRFMDAMERAGIGTNQAKDLWGKCDNGIREQIANASVQNTCHAVIHGILADVLVDTKGKLTTKGQ